MPYHPSASCPTCHKQVDPLRARAVSVSERGVLTFCSRSCRDELRSRPHGMEAGHPPASATQPQNEREVPLAAERSGFASAMDFSRVPESVPPAGPSPDEASAPGPWILAPLALAGGLSQLAGAPEQWACLALVMVTVGLVASRAKLQRTESGVLAWLGAPIGAVGLAGLGAWLGQSSLALAGVLAVGLVWLREWLATRMERPITNVLNELSAQVPRSTRLSFFSDDDHPAEQTRTRETQRVRAGDEVHVSAGDVAPVDGVVSEGSAQVIPYAACPDMIERGPGDALLAGAKIVEGSLKLTATRVREARALFRPKTFGQDGTPGSARPTRTIAIVRSPLSLALYVAFVWLVSLSLATSVHESAVAIGAGLVTLPMLSLVRGVRMPFVSAAALSASRGVVFRDADTLERAGRVVTAALCMEGGVTLGAPTLIEVTALGSEHDQNSLTALAMGAELGAEHHALAGAILRFGEARGVKPASLRRISHVPGRGITALLDGGGSLVFGNRQALLSAGVSVAVADREARRAELSGRSVVFLAVGGRVRGVFVFEDPVRPHARAAVQTLIDLDLETVLISGDHRTTVESLARTLDITHIKAELTREERGAEISRLRSGGHQVLVVGRPAHDEAALAAADIALTLDAAGGIHEGDVAVASHDLRDAAFGVAVARRTRNMAQSALWTTGIGGIGIAALTALKVLPPAVAILFAAAIDVWALPRAARLLRSPEATLRRIGPA